MGAAISNYGRYVGMLAAVLFIAAAFVMLLVKGGDDGALADASLIVLTLAGVVTLVYGAISVKENPKSYDKILITLLGVVTALVFVFAKVANMDGALVIEIVGIIAIVTMICGIMRDKSVGNKTLMYIDIGFLIIEAIVVILMFAGTSLAVTEATAVILIGLWLAAYITMGTDAVVEKAAAVDPNRKSAKKAQKLKDEQEAKAKKDQERQEKLEAKAKADKAKQKKAEHEAKKEEIKTEHEAKKEEIKTEHEAKKAEHEAKKVEEPAESKEQIKAAPAEPAKEEPKAAEPVQEEPKPVEPAKEEPKKINNDFMSRLVSSKDVGGKVVPPVKAEPRPAEPAKEEPASVEPVQEEPVQEEPVQEEPVQEEPVVAEPAKEEPKAVEPIEEEPEPAEPVTEEPVQEEPVVAEPAKEEPASVEPVQEEPVVAEPGPVETEPVSEPEPVDETVSEESDDDEVLEDIYTDYSPEALVRRAAWNKGMRCRRDYGDYHIPVAFVKGKVAVYVEEPGSEDLEVEAKLKEDGWVVLRYDINKVTDGLVEGAEIADTVKANMRAQKAAKKKKSAKK